MPAQSTCAIERELARRLAQEHARVCLQPPSASLVARLAFWRDEHLVRKALKAAGEPGLILDVACGAGRFWPVLAEHANRVILASDLSQDMLDHAPSHHPQDLLKRVRTFQSSTFTLGLSANAVDCIFCMQQFQYILSPEHRSAMLGEFHRVSRDTVIVAVCIDACFKRRRPTVAGTQAWQSLDKAEVEAEFIQAGFRLLSHQDFLPGYVRMRVYVLRKA